MKFETCDVKSILFGEMFASNPREEPWQIQLKIKILLK